MEWKISDLDMKRMQDFFNNGDHDKLLFLIRRIILSHEGGVKKISIDASLGRESLYKSLAEGSTPQLMTFIKIFRSLGLNIQIFKSHNQPERSKREDAKLKNPCSNCWNEIKEHASTCVEFYNIAMRCSEHCGNTVREAQETSSPRKKE